MLSGVNIEAINTLNTCTFTLASTPDLIQLLPCLVLCENVAALSDPSFVLCVIFFIVLRFILLYVLLFGPWTCMKQTFHVFSKNDIKVESEM